MKKIIFTVGCAFFVLNRLATAYAADTSTCYNIQDSDASTYCLARAHKEPGQCYSIQRPDMRSQCLAEVRK